jgi:hypothetical protein
LTADPARLVRFTLRLEGFEDEHTIHELRRLMKRLCRTYGLRCTEVRQEAMDTDESKLVIAHHRVEALERSNDAIPARDRALRKAHGQRFLRLCSNIKGPDAGETAVDHFPRHTQHERSQD